VVVGKSQSGPGFWRSEGADSLYERVQPRDDVYSRDVMLAIPGAQAEVVPNSRGVKLTLFGNLPELSDSSALDSAVILHDTSAYDLDGTLLRGRIVLVNTKEKGEAKVWLRADRAGVQLVMPEPGDSAALEIYGRWARGVPFSLKRGEQGSPVLLWDVYAI